MKARRLVGVGVELVAVVVVVSLVAGQVAGTPILLSFVETGSMEPTIDTGDGFVAVPAALTDDPETGDVVVYRAEEIQGGGLTTHRVVGETDRGYVTRGDANPFTDQDNDEPPVKDAQIVAEALQVGGTVVVVPELGTAVMAIQASLTTAQRTLAATLGARSLLGTQGLAYVVLALSIVFYLFDLVVGDGTGRDRERSRRRDGDGRSTRLVLAGLAAVLVLSATAAMVVPAGSQEFGVVSAEFDSDRPTVIRQGETATLEYAVPNGGFVPMYVYLRPASDGVRVDPDRLQVAGRSSATASVTLTAPAETGYYRRYLQESRYLAVLPASVVDGLHAVHPWLPVLVIDALLAAAVYVPGRLFLDEGRLRDRRRAAHGTGSVVRTLRNWLFGT
jgi:signal peptidase